MRKGETVLLGIGKGENEEFYACEYLGRGMYATAYKRLKDERVFLFMREVEGEHCYMKDAIREFADMDNPHVPKIRFEYELNENDKTMTRPWIRVFSMPYYRPLMAQYGEAWKAFRALKKANGQAIDEILLNHYFELLGKPNAPSWRTHGGEIARRTIELADVPNTLKMALESILGAISNYGTQCTFEFSKVNLGVDSEDRLVLRDIAFDTNKVESAQKARAEKREKNNL